MSSKKLKSCAGILPDNMIFEMQTVLFAMVGVGAFIKRMIENEDNELIIPCDSINVNTLHPDITDNTEEMFSFDIAHDENNNFYLVCTKKDKIEIN